MRAWEDTTLLKIEDHTKLGRGAIRILYPGGFSGEINARRLMPMKAGTRFSHEEHVLPGGGQLQGLRIFIGAPLIFRSRTWIYDAHLASDVSLYLPELPQAGLTCLLCVFEGIVTIGAEVLRRGDSLIVRGDSGTELQSADADPVLFVTDEHSPHFDGGIFTGNQAQVAGIPA